MTDRTPAYEAPAPNAFVGGPAHYPGHAYTGRGTIVVVRAGTGPDDVAGWLTRQGDRLGWLSLAKPGSDAETVRWIVEAALRRMAAEDVPVPEAWDRLLALTWHDWPTEGPLEGLQGLVH